MYDPVERRNVFVSHASEDAPVAHDIVSRLESGGVSCWIALRDVKPGAAYADSLYHAIEQAPVFVILMSAAANKSVHIVRELEIADQMGKRVVPVRLEDFEATGAFCYYTRASHFYRWKEDPEHVLFLISEQVQRATAEHVDTDRQAVASHDSRREHWWRSLARRLTKKD